MAKTHGITPLVGAHYPERTPDGRTIARSEPPGVVVLHEDGTVTLRQDDKPFDPDVEIQTPKLTAS